jgi:thiol-disulfide isomerase/thioredoxin
LDGEDVELSSLKGKVVLLNFWATWYGPCKKEIPWFVEFQKTASDEYGGVESLPTSFLIDRQGRVAAIQTGLVQRPEYMRDLEALLGK